nr:DNA mismatch repair endonuclease MutL [Ardenticatena sp.]
MPIHILPPDVANKIAAGEVVERPASVVKELVENALDAGATDIRVEIAKGGQSLIRVADNGCGIPADEVELAFQHHATSKVYDADDLFAIQTLGFRGEALPSIAAVSRVTVLTRPREQPAGVELRLEGGKVVARRTAAAPAGTIITVEDLFFNVPARRKFLRTVATETSLIAEIVSHYALAYPERRFTLIADGRTTLQTAGSGDLKDALLAVYGLDVARHMLMLEEPPDPETGIGLFGAIGGPALHRANRKYIIFFVNGRVVRSPMLTTAIAQAYQGVVPTGRHPFVVLDIQVPPDQIDVNVHPQKLEIKFARSDEVFRVVQRAVRRLLVEEAPVHQFSRTIEVLDDTDEASPSPAHLPPEPLDENDVRVRLFSPPPPTGHPTRTTWVPSAPPPAPTTPTPPPDVGGTKLPPLRVLGQTMLTYIICEGPDGLYLIDQHTAHERVLLERLRKQRARQAVPSQRLLQPLTIELTPQQMAVVEEQREALLHLGFDVEPFGGLTVLVRAIPEVLKHKPDPAAALAEVIDGAIHDRSGLSWEERLVMYAACRGAVKAGDPLTHEEMVDLIRQLEQTDLSRTCAHGRPTVVRLSVEQLEREFGRR